jgi:hypothetical protein
MKEVQASGEASSFQHSPSSFLKTIYFFTFSFYCGAFYPPGYGSKSGVRKERQALVIFRKNIYFS